MRNSPTLVILNIPILTQNVFGSQLEEILELEVNVNNSHAASDCQDDDVTTQDFL